MRQPPATRRRTSGVTTGLAVADAGAPWPMTALAGGLFVLVGAIVAGCGGSSDVELSGAAARGQVLTRDLGCAACHGGADASATIGPSWVGSWGDDVEMSDGTVVRFDASYVVSSVRQPDVHRRTGDWRRMPAYASDQLTDAEVADIVAYLKELG